MMKEWGGLFALAIGILFAGCGEEQQVEEAGSTWPTGTVLETMDGGGYTYAQVETGGGAMWVAGPVTPLQVGEAVTLVDTMFMGAFPSKALERTFDSLYFVASFMEAPEPTPPAFPAAVGTAIQVVHTGGYTYVEVEEEDGAFWLAGPETEITEGTRVQWKGPMVMRDFHSSSLDRTFAEIIFVDSVWMVEGAESGPASERTTSQES